MQNDNDTLRQNNVNLQQHDAMPGMHDLTLLQHDTPLSQDNVKLLQTGLPAGENPPNLLHLGIDIGSTTMKLVALKEDRIVYSTYQRHFSNLKETLIHIMNQAAETLGNPEVTILVTGSGGVSIAQFLTIGHIQEVVATVRAAQRFTPDVDVAIELGGEDAKIVYFEKAGIDQRMNGICAGGTGAFIDQMAAVLNTDPTNLDRLAEKHTSIFPIASRCGVFAKTDIMPLINEGVGREDIAASIFQSVVNQTVSGLSCGKPIKGKVMFLGGPLSYLPQLRKRFVETLKLKDDAAILPDSAHLFVALGAALASMREKTVPFDVLHRKILSITKMNSHEVKRLPPLFSNAAEKEDFFQRHHSKQVKKSPISSAFGNCYLGMDAGSTTIKAVLLNDNGELIYSYYGGNQGKPFETAREILLDIYGKLQESCCIKNSAVTGYGEELLKTALGMDIGEVETVAHYRAARQFLPDVDFILDIGGQDMKCLKIRDGFIESVLLNEACSSGCGSFIESFAQSLNIKVDQFATMALSAEHPVDLGTRCTVFMNSRVKQAQKEGASIGDISAGLSYAVIKNALTKVMNIRTPEELGEHVVVQGGTFLNDAVLRCFETISGKKAVRPDIAGLMGAYGAALIAKERFQAHHESTLLSKEALLKVQVNKSHHRCKRCTNRCSITVNTFSHGGRIHSGNKCENGAAFNNRAAFNNVAACNLKGSELPNLFQYELKRIFSYTPLPADQAIRGTIGIPRGLNIYNNYPFWFTFFTRLGFSVELSPISSRKIYEMGMDTIPSDTLCYPAKLIHGHMAWLVNQGVERIFYPCIPYEQNEFSKADNHYNCPIVTSYPEIIKNNMDILGEKNIQFISPFLPFNDVDRLIVRLSEELKPLGIRKKEIAEAVSEGLKELAAVQNDIRRKGDETLRFLEQRGTTGIVLAGKPYHLDPEVNHGIDRIISSLGMAVLTVQSVCHKSSVERPLLFVDQWMFQSRVYEAAGFVSNSEHLELVHLNSFGCGLDAISLEQARELLKKRRKVHTAIKIDEMSRSGIFKIRIRSLKAAVMEKKRRGAMALSPFSHPVEKIPPHLLDRVNKQNLLLFQLSPVHDQFFEAAFKASGYNLNILSATPQDDRDVIDEGLKYVNNDVCFPAVVMIGQYIKALKSGKYDLDNTYIALYKTGGMCRATNYIGFMRKALAAAGFWNIPVIQFSPTRLGSNNAIKITPALLNKYIISLLYGDLLLHVLHRVRPYEKIKGSANRLYEIWVSRCKASVIDGDRDEFKRNIYQIVREFESIEINDIVKPRVGIVGEILVKYHPLANNDIIHTLESYGAEVTIPGLANYVMYSAYDSWFKHKKLSWSAKKYYFDQIVIQVVEYYRRHMKRALRKSRRFEAPPSIRELAQKTSEVLSLGHQAGEGWFLTGEMIEQITGGIHNIVCIQPFACLANQITGKGMMKELKRRYPHANIISIDFDPGASEINQLNRLKLMLSVAFDKMENRHSP
ncbi:CoA-substrate-specific enzyme activase [Desulfamplus magnetovallimortis]|uniref:CoA-substrate-specific enzyme activase n=1 Tax=Desulfamplus magnetovallimortis TaxID=1246637 RepID=A0A1W1HAI3_9BACT|nr:2-hydroxyacyl-CoA dehydratase [Desulfamplus magnetovallimortis]SLM29487.1 CoA-substrate-specific enzyme activase [Desulfamplus magnetovallimortis]